jgi:hypothetical protein
MPVKQDKGVVLQNLKKKPQGLFRIKPGTPRYATQSLEGMRQKIIKTKRR